jgi:hypothetical protein
MKNGPLAIGKKIALIEAGGKQIMDIGPNWSLHPKFSCNMFFGVGFKNQVLPV